jgi:hypothetical protein
MAYKLADLLYKLEMDGFEWEELIRELERKKEKRQSVPLRIRETVYQEFKKECADNKISDVVEVLMIGFVRFQRARKKKKPEK